MIFTNADSPAPPVILSESKTSSSEKPQTVSGTSPAGARLTTPEALDRIVLQSAPKHRVDPKLIRAVIATESNWNSRAVSPKGAQGLMQLIPSTARKLGVANAFDPAQNVDGGVRYLRMMLERYNGDLHKALAAYNASPGAVDRFGGVPNFRETREYIRRVTSTYLGPGSDGQAPALAVSNPIYRATDTQGRLVFTNQ